MDNAWKAATKFFFENGNCHKLKYRGVHIGKNPLDLWIYSELIERVRPELIVEFGTQQGGSAAWLADQMERCHQRPQVITVDRSDRHKHRQPQLVGIQYLVGHSTSAEIFEKINQRILRCNGPVMFSEDSSHTYENVSAELSMYAHLTTVGSYFVVEDGVLNLVMERPGMGAYKAIQDFLKLHAEFEADKSCEKFGITFHPSGFLKRIK